MQLGRYHLLSPLGAGPAGARFRARDESGGEWELRFLDQAIADAPAQAAFERRLRLLSLLDHPAALCPADSDLAHAPPYLVLPPSESPTELEAGAVFPGTAEGLASLLVAAHRLGLTLARADDSVLRARGGRHVIDLTGTAGPAREGPELPSEPADDVAWLGDLFARLWPDDAAIPADRRAGWRTLLHKMRAPSVSERPLAEEVAAWFQQPSASGIESRAADLGATVFGPGRAVAPPAAPVEAGRRLGRFVLLEKLGEGGMGAVFRARDEADGSTVAVKVLRDAVVGSEVARRRFIKEGRLLAALDSPYVTRLVEANSDGNVCFLALEYVEGRNLGQVLRAEGRLDEAAALDYVADAARGLAAAHAVGIVHRDVKPDNLLVTPADPARSPAPRLKVTDFGLARQVVQTGSLDVTRDGAIVGTPLYMAPEQFGADLVDTRADVYALGATLYHLLAGREPFPYDTLPALLQAQAAGPPPPLDTVNPAVSAPVAAFVARCLSKDPAARPADAAQFLHALERARGNEPDDLHGHPRTPAGEPGVREYVLTWELAAPPARLWPYVSNTERLNRAAGLPPVRYELRRDPQLGTRRFAAARVAGMLMEWEEHPFEWVEGRRMGVLREFSRGPFAWFTSVVELRPRPDGGTTLRQTLRARPRGLLGRLAARVELGIKARHSLGRVYRRIDALLSSAGDARPAEDPFEAPTQLPRARQARLLTGVARLRERGVSAEAAETLGTLLANAPDQEVARVRPLALARRFGVDGDAMTEACLRAVGEGLLELKWDVICPLCRIPSGTRDRLKDLREHENCPACDADFRTNLAEAVELVFRVHPDIRAAETGAYCAGGPAHSPHVVAQAVLAAGEQVELELSLSEGSYRLRGPRLPWSLGLRVTGGPGGRRVEIDLGQSAPPPAGSLAAGGQVLVLRNTRPHELLVRVERTAVREDALTAARAAALPAFRELFPGELLAPGRLVPASAVTLLLTQIEGGESIYDRLGEARAFELLQAFFRAADERVRAEGGAVVKTVGEGLLAAFSEVSAGVRAALSLGESAAVDPLLRDVRLKAVVHKGLALVATLNDRLDYFGHTVKTAGRLLDAAAGAELLLSVGVASDPEVDTLLRGRPAGLVELSRNDRGQVLAYRLALAGRPALAPGTDRELLSVRQTVDAGIGPLP